MVALEQWPREGLPPNPDGWILVTARRRAIDRIRRDRTFAVKAEQLARLEGRGGPDPSAPPPGAVLDAEPGIEDDRLRLLFAVCHPALAIEARVALALRLLGGLTTGEVARAFLVDEPTMGQRISRAKRKIRDGGIPFEEPRAADLPARLEAVLAAVYLIFSEGHAARTDEALVRRGLCDEAIRLALLLAELAPGEPEVAGLLALLLLHDARRDVRVDPAGELVLLEEQDRSRWDRGRIAEGLIACDRAARLTGDHAGPYLLEACIAVEHARARHAADTDWPRIARLYAELETRRPTAVVRLNRAVAVAMADGPRAGLMLLEALRDDPGLRGHHLLPAARADLLRRLGDGVAARTAYEEALALATNPVERRFLERRLAGS